MPHEFVDSLDEAAVWRSDRRVYLVVGQGDTRQIDRLAGETAVVVLPSPDLTRAPGHEAQGDAGAGRWGGGETGRTRRERESRRLALTPTLSQGDREIQPSAQRAQNSALDTRQFRVLEEPTAGGYLVRIAADLIGGAFALLARTEEYAPADRDQHDRFQWANSRLEPPELAARPLVSEYAQLLLACLKEACVHARLPMARKEFWPSGRPMAGCLTHDVDVVRRGKLPRGIAIRDIGGALSSVARGRWRAAATRVATIARTAASDQDPYWSFDRISALEARHDYRSTYYFMAGHHHPEDGSYDLDKPPLAPLLRALAESGCEIGLHGSYASYTDSVLLQTQKADLEQRMGRAVTGHRNHFLRFRVPDSWRAQEAAGFSYDATLGYNDREGFRGGHAFPFHPYDLGADRSLDLMEIPLAIMDVGLLKYRRLREEKAHESVVSVLEQTRSVNGLATLLWHNHTCYDPEYPGAGRLYERALDWLAARDAHVATAEEIDGWWRARAAVRLSPLAGGRTGWRMETPREIAALVLRVSMPDPQAFLRVRGQVPLTIKREGMDYLLEFGLLPPGFAMDVEYA